MDLERELIKAENWPELKRFYSHRAGATWELGWLSLLKDNDIDKAIEYFSLSLKDPHHEEASYILLRKLERKISTRPPELPPSFRLFEAYETGDFGYLNHFLSRSRDNERYFAALIGGAIDKLGERDLVLIEKFSRPASISLRLGVHCDRKLKNHSWAGAFYREYYTNPWSKRVLEEARRLFLDSESQRVLKNAYAQHDGISARRVLKALAARLAKANDQMISAVWRSSFKKAVEWEIDHLTENITSFPFWTLAEISPRAVHLVAREMFLEEKLENPSSIQFWRHFFSESDLQFIPTDLDPESLSLWQIRVEMNHDLLSEALLKFPTEERFLFLWSLKHRDAAEKDPRGWPLEQKESNVVRKNLERAFDRATNKVLWFDRLRQSGCSQDFYEYVLGRTRIPITWILEDLDRGVVNAAPKIRDAIRAQLATIVPEQSDSFNLEPTEFAKALSFLTPAETQQVLLSRYVISDIPKEVLNDEYLDLFWDARSRVDQKTVERWKKNILVYLASKPMKNFQRRHWQWVEAGWETQPDSLDRFSPSVEMQYEFPWDLYLEQLDRHEKHDLLLTCLHRIPDERLKESWLHRMMELSADHRLFAAINTLRTDFVRYSLLSRWYEKKGDLDRSMSYRVQELESCPIMNEQISIARGAIEMVRASTESPSLQVFDSLTHVGQFLEINGGLDASLCRELSLIAYQFQQWERSWKWALAEWSRSSEAERATLLEHFLRTAFQARAIEDAQRVLVDYLFHLGSPNPLTHEILNQLLNPSSSFKLKHLRKEFIDRAAKIFPLHPEVLKARAGYDYRALLLWDAFYGQPLEIRAELSTPLARRQFTLWGLTDSSTPPENFSKFAHYIESVHKVKVTKVTLEFLDDARRIASRLAKHFSIRKELQIVVTPDLEVPLKIYLTQPAIQVDQSFFEELDEELWSAICVGVYQVLSDFDRGLYEPRRLMERFFQGAFLAGTPIAKLIRLWVWLAVSEGLSTPQILKTDPEKLVETLPFVNSLLIFYLGDDFESKAAACGLLPN